jgi:hypothetical protein
MNPIISKKKGQILILIILFSGIFLTFFPFEKKEALLSTEETHLKKEVSLYVYRASPPWRSFNQNLSLNIEVKNGTISLLVLNDTALYNFNNNNSFNPYIIKDNVSEAQISIPIKPPVRGDLTLVLWTDVSEAILCGKAVLKYFYFNTNFGIFLIFIGTLGVIYYLYKSNKHFKSQNGQK